MFGVQGLGFGVYVSGAGFRVGFRVRGLWSSGGQYSPIPPKPPYCSTPTGSSKFPSSFPPSGHGHHGSIGLKTMVGNGKAVTWRV